MSSVKILKGGMFVVQRGWILIGGRDGLMTLMLREERGCGTTRILIGGSMIYRKHKQWEPCL